MGLGQPPSRGPGVAFSSREADREIIYLYFGTFSRGILSMCELTLGNWVAENTEKERDKSAKPRAQTDNSQRELWGQQSRNYPKLKKRKGPPVMLSGPDQPRAARARVGVVSAGAES